VVDDQSDEDENKAFIHQEESLVKEDDRNVVYLRTMNKIPRSGTMEVKPEPDIYVNPERLFRSTVATDDGAQSHITDPLALRTFRAEFQPQIFPNLVIFGHFAPLSHVKLTPAHLALGVTG
jgi:hypothetical protein